MTDAADFVAELAARPAATRAITRGVQRAFMDLGYAPVLELPLANGRRADVCGVNAKGEIAIAEVKSGIDDFVADLKWPEYREFCDTFYFAVDADFPLELLPEEQSEIAPGIILADRFGGAVLRPSPIIPVPAARRKAMTLSVARLAAQRLAILSINE
jgi:hypothetical protein